MIQILGVTHAPISKLYKTHWFINSDFSGTLTLVCHWKFREKEWTHRALQDSFIGVRVLKWKSRSSGPKTSSLRRDAPPWPQVAITGS